MTFGRIPIDQCVYGHQSEWQFDCSVCWEERPPPKRKQGKKTGKLVRTKKVSVEV